VVIGYCSLIKNGSGQLDTFRTPEIQKEIKKFPEKSGSLDANEYVSILKDIVKAGKNLLIARNFEKIDFAKIRADSGLNDYLHVFTKPHDTIQTIDMWIVEDFVTNFQAAASVSEFPHTFFGSENNNEQPFVNYSDTSSLIIQLGYILSSASFWKVHTRLRAISIVRSQDQVDLEALRLAAYLYKCRVKANVKVLCLADMETQVYDARVFNQFLRAHSDKTCVSFFPLNPLPKGKKAYSKYIHETGVLSEGVKPIFLVRANERVITTEI